MKRVHALLATFAGLLIANPLWAQGMHEPGGMRGMMQGPGMHMMQDADCPMMGMSHLQGFYLSQAEELGLNPTQIAKLEKIKSEAQKALIKKEADLKIARLELQDLMKDPKARRSELEAKAKRVENLKSEIRLAEFKATLDARAVLTPEQLQKAQNAKSCKAGKMSMSMRSAENGNAGCRMMGNSTDGKSGGSSEHEKHHPKG